MQIKEIKLPGFLKNPSQFWLRLLIAFSAAVIFRYPFWLFQFDAGDLQSLKPWDQGFKLMCTWDCGIYGSLSEIYDPKSSAFFPGFPLLIRFFHLLFPSLSTAAATLAVSNVFALLSGTLALFVGESLWDATQDRKILGFSKRSWFLLLALSIFPESHFWMRGYSEPVFMALLLAIVYFIRTEKWLWAAPFLGFISILRPQGIWVAGLALVYLALSRLKRNAMLVVSVSFITLIPLSLFFGWLWLKTGNPFYFYSLQSSGWGRKFNLLSGLEAHLPRFEASTLYLYLSLFAAYRFLKRKEHAWKFLGILTFALADLPLFVGGYYSYVRFMSVNLGLFILLSEVMEENPRWSSAILIWCISRLAVQTYHASFGLWVG